MTITGTVLTTVDGTRTVLVLSESSRLHALVRQIYSNDSIIGGFLDERRWRRVVRWSKEVGAETDRHAGIDRDRKPATGVQSGRRIDSEGDPAVCRIKKVRNDVIPTEVLAVHPHTDIRPAPPRSGGAPTISKAQVLRGCQDCALAVRILLVKFPLECCHRREVAAHRRLAWCRRYARPHCPIYA